MNDSSAAPRPPAEAVVNSSRTAPASLWPPILFGGVLAVVSVATYFLIFRVERLPLISRDSFAAATRQWEAAGLANYDVTVTVHARTTDVYHTEVRGGRVLSATRNGTALDQPRTMGTWSVPGMFDTIDADLTTQAERPVDPSVKKVDLMLRGRFNDQSGYPERYQRIEWGAEREIEFEVTEFRLVQP